MSLQVVIYTFRRYLSLIKTKINILRMTREQNDFYKRYQTSRIERDYRLNSAWNYFENPQDGGQYFKSMKLREEILTELYHSQDFFNKNEIPPYLSHRWASNIGHLGALGILIKFQDLFVGKTQQQTMYLTNPNLFGIFGHLFANKVKTSINPVLKDMETPTMWSQFQNLEMIRIKDRFIPHYSMYEEFFNTEPITRFNAPLSDHSERDKVLGLLNLKPSDRFISIHIRTPIKNDMRSVIPSKFVKALNLLIDLGFQVVQFGEEGPSLEVKRMDRLIKLPYKGNWKSLQSSIISHSEFLICTNSGPAALAWALGVPVLQTDTVALCRNILTCSNGSIYLPKSFKKRNIHIPLSELVSSGLGYTEYSRSELRKQGIELIDSSEIEIFKAVLEMLDFRNSKDNEFSKHRQNLGIIGRGKIATDYLTSNNWLKV